MSQNTLRYALHGAIGLCLAVPLLAYADSTYDLPAQSLRQAITDLSNRAGVSITLNSDVAENLTAAQVKDAQDLPAAIDQLLSGTGLSWRQRSAEHIEIVGSGASASGVDKTLQALRVEGSGSSVDLSGFGIGAGVNGSSDSTATEGSKSFAGLGSSIASKIPATLKETPYSVSVVTHEQLRQQNISDTDGALKIAPGITTVESANGPTFLSRGFEIQSYQVDGGAPRSLKTPIGSTNQDLFAYDHVEVLRGAGAVFSGVGQPSGVINLQRKRPVDSPQLIVDGQYGSYDDGRGQVDYSTPINEEQTVRARIVAATQKNDYFYKYTNKEQNNLYGVLEADVSDNTTLRGGLRYQKSETDAPDFFGLPLYQDGRNPHFSRTTNFAAKWAFSDTRETEYFAQLDHRFENDWKFNVNVSRSLIKSDGNRPNLSGALADDGTGVEYGTQIHSKDEMKQWTVDASLAGDFELLGREHAFVAGGSYTETKSSLNSALISHDLALGNIRDFDPADLPNTPASDANTKNTGSTRELLTAGYFALKLNPFDRVHVAVGARYSDLLYKSDSVSDINFPEEGLNFNSQLVQRSQFSGNVTPSLAISYDLTDNVTTYASVAKVFNDNASEMSKSADGALLEPEKGKTTEYGFKYASDSGDINASIAYFRTIMDNVAIQLPEDVCLAGALGQDECYSAGGALLSRGVDVEVSGALTPTLQVTASYTYVDTSYNSAFEEEFNSVGSVSSVSQSQQPRHQVKVWGAWTLPGQLSDFTLSGGLRMESARSIDGTTCTAGNDTLTGKCEGPTSPFSYEQKLYTVADLRLAYQVDKNWEVAGAVTNLTDTRYFATMSDPTSGTHYGEPRQFMLSAQGRF